MDGCCHKWLMMRTKIVQTDTKIKSQHHKLFLTTSLQCESKNIKKSTNRWDYDWNSWNKTHFLTEVCGDSAISVQSVLRVSCIFAFPPVTASWRLTNNEITDALLKTCWSYGCPTLQYSAVKAGEAVRGTAPVRSFFTQDNNVRGEIWSASDDFDICSSIKPFPLKRYVHMLSSGILNVYIII